MAQNAPDQPDTSSPTSRTIQGAVMDQTGAKIPGAIVMIKDLKTLQVRSYIVQKDGTYRFSGLSPDANYQLHARFNNALSGSKTVSIFDSKPVIIVNLKVKTKHS